MRALVLVVAGCGRVGFDPTGATGDAAPDAACMWTPFSAPAALPGPIQSATDDWSPAPTLGETQIFFHSYRGSTRAQLWFATRASTDVAFGAAVNLTVTNTAMSQQFAPTLSADGLLLIYADSATGHFKLMTAERNAPTGMFGLPTQLANVNAAGVEDNYPFVSADGLDLVWSSTRTGAFHTIWEAVRPDRSSSFGAPQSHLELGPDGFEEWAPSLSADGLDVYFSSNRSGGPGGFDVYTAHRPSRDQPFAAAVLIPELSSQRDDVGVRLSRDGAAMYLNYDAVTSGGNADLDIATRSCM